MSSNIGAYRLIDRVGNRNMSRCKHHTGVNNGRGGGGGGGRGLSIG